MVNSTNGATSVRLGFKENWQQFSLRVLIKAFVGGMVGIERTVVPLIGSEEFHIESTALIASFIISFGVVVIPATWRSIGAYSALATHR